jgi:cytochrome c5
MPKQQTTAIILAFAAWIMPQPADAQGAGRSGKAVVEAVCASCHATGAKGAPKIGDDKAWASLASRGLTGLTESALKGIRNMPPHGGNPGLTDSEIERAITYMVNQSGGRWSEPISDVTSAAERRGEQIVQAQCAKCHQTGVSGAPRIGDRAAWIPRLRRGLDFVVRSAINGHGPMPPRGGMADLTDSEIRAAVVYMFNPVATPTAASSDAPSARPDPNHKVIDGTEIFLGVVAAESMRAQYAKGSKESSMHGGIPAGRGHYHVNISLFDGKTRAVIPDAQVEVSVANPVSGAVTKKLELVTLNNIKSYGNYFRMPGKDAYTITVKIRRPGAARTIEAVFSFKRQ